MKGMWSNSRWSVTEKWVCLIICVRTMSTAAQGCPSVLKDLQSGASCFPYPCFSSEDENHTEPPTWLYGTVFPLGVCHSFLSSLVPHCLSSQFKGAPSLLQQTLSLCTMGLTLPTGEAVRSRLAHQSIRSIGLCRGIQHLDCDWCMEMEERSYFHAGVTEKGEWVMGLLEAILFPCSKKNVWKKDRGLMIEHDTLLH